MPFLLFGSNKNEIMKKIIYLIQNQSIKNIVSATSKMTIVRIQFVTTQNDVGFTRKKVQIISLIERGFERLGLGHRTGVSRGVRMKLNRVRLRSLSP